MNNFDYFKISRILQNHYAIFYKMWELGRPIMDDSIPTACIKFSKGGLSYHFNPKFWDSLSNENRAFVIAHECLHVILDHGNRFKNNHSQGANVAMDVAIHEIMFNLGFKTDLKDIATRETIFQNKVKSDRNAEYYYNKLPKNYANKTYLQIDLHDFLSEKEIHTVIQRLGKEYNELVNSYIGKEAGLKSITVYTPYSIKAKWESVIKNWSDSVITDYSWVVPNRRTALLNQILPTEYDMDGRKSIDVFFFQDTSGSCEHLAERFFKAAKSLPDTFNIKLFCFDTKVYEVDIKDGKLFGFGGTNFGIIEQAVQKYRGTKYPSVFVITDGYGTQVKPQFPEKWYWFLSDDYKTYIPDKSNVFMLSDYE